MPFRAPVSSQVISPLRCLHLQALTPSQAPVLSQAPVEVPSHSQALTPSRLLHPPRLISPPSSIPCSIPCPCRGAPISRHLHPQAPAPSQYFAVSCTLPGICTLPYACPYRAVPSHSKALAPSQAPAPSQVNVKLPLLIPDLCPPTLLYLPRLLYPPRSLPLSLLHPSRVLPIPSPCPFQAPVELPPTTWDLAPSQTPSSSLSPCPVLMPSTSPC